jgi:hypothetical protein
MGSRFVLAQTPFLPALWMISDTNRRTGSTAQTTNTMNRDKRRTGWLIGVGCVAVVGKTLIQETPPDPVESLLRRYREAFDGPTTWAYPLPPSVPFVGRNYEAGALKIALYASAENLTHYESGKPLPPYCQGDEASNRHRGAYTVGWDKFFPPVHIAPVENGSLLCATLYLLQQHLGGPLPETPADLMERLCIANVGKFSIRTGGKANQDYAGSRRLLEASLPYLRADLDTLRPEVLMLPRAMLKQPAIRAVVAASIPGALVLPLPQFNATVVNVHLAPHADRAAELEQTLRGTLVSRWTDELRGYRSGYPYRYYVEIDDVFERRAPHR